MEYVVLSLLAASVAVAFMACVADLKSMRIPNAYSLIIAALFIPAFLLAPSMFFPWWHHLASFALMFILGYLMFACKVMGGGDSKLAAAFALWLGLKPLLLFMLVMALAGGVLGVATIYLQKKKPFKNPLLESWIDLAQRGKNAVPYGIAITSGFLASFLHIPLILN